MFLLVSVVTFVLKMCDYNCVLIVILFQVFGFNCKHHQTFKPTNLKVNMIISQIDMLNLNLDRSHKSKRRFVFKELKSVAIAVYS